MTVPSLAETVASFDARSDGYDRSQMHQVVAQEVAGALDPQPGQTLLDLAGGTGLVARAALPHLRKALVLDASPGMLRQARREQPELLLLRADAHHVPLRDDCVDLVTCVTALHLFAEPARALREAARTCRPNGRVVFTTFAKDGWSAGRALRQAAAATGLVVADPAAATGTPDAAADLANVAGLTVEDLVEVRSTEPLEDREQAWLHASRSKPGTTDEVRRRFDELLGDEVEHVLLLLTCRPQTSSPSR